MLKTEPRQKNKFIFMVFLFSSLAFYLGLLLGPYCTQVLSGLYKESSSRLEQDLVGRKPKYPLEVRPLSEDHQFLDDRSADSSPFWQIIPYYQAQSYPWSCSLASLVMVFNAARATQLLWSDQSLIQEDDLIRLNRGQAWRRKNGVSLEELGHDLQAFPQDFGLNLLSVFVYHVERIDGESEKRLDSDLFQMQQGRGQVFMIANFNQGVITEDAQLGHFAPVGAYDRSAQRVLILDPDRQWYEPYWVSFSRFLRAMATMDSSNSQARGYLLIKFKK